MLIKELFAKDIFRPIDTVVMANNQDQLAQEVEEYIITTELTQKLIHFLENYNQPGRALSGVWISGFFGSGKSHLLKILSLLLPNAIEVEGCSISELFVQKAAHDAFLQSEIRKATAIPSESILFNVDREAPQDAPYDILLATFYKVFYNYLGYEGADFKVAALEYWLDQEMGQYRNFISAYADQGGNNWEHDRRMTFNPAVKGRIARACAQVCGGEAQQYASILDELKAKHHISKEHFAARVREYIDRRDKAQPGFRLNFFVDEIGQFVADDTHRLLSLQTIVESLAEACGNRAWVLVTSQEELGGLLDNHKHTASDFFKIKDRFYTRMSLSSANAEEVVEKRLLVKTTPAAAALRQRFAQQQANLETMLAFDGAGLKFRTLSDAPEFADKYPFLPYQFDLFKECVRTLSGHNAFMGQHTSVGARSMLAVFKEVLVEKSTESDTLLVGFDALFDGLRSQIRTEVQNAIILAERHLQNPLGVRLLKALFMVKYLESFKASARNLSVLLIDSQTIDLRAHEQQVQDALAELERQVYIQRQGPYYAFLTNEEKDIESEIREVKVEDEQLSRKIYEMLSGTYFPDRRLQVGGYSFPYTTLVDGHSFGSAQELGIHLVTVLGGIPDGQLAAMTLTRNTVVVRMPDNLRILDDLRHLLRTESYLRQKQASATDTRALIMGHKAQGLGKQFAEVTNQLAAQLAASTIYASANAQPAGTGSNPKALIERAADLLVEAAYYELPLLGGANHTEAQLQQLLKNTQADAFTEQLSAPEDRIMQVIQSRKRAHERTTVEDLLRHFGKMPFGWPTASILYLLASLFKRGKIEARKDGELYASAQAFGKDLLNTHMHALLQLDAQAVFRPAQLQALRETYLELFGKTAPQSDPRTMGEAFKAETAQLLQEVRALMEQKRDYPFLQQLQPFAQLLQQLAQKDYVQLIECLDGSELQEELLEQAEAHYRPCANFCKGPHGQSFRKATSFLGSDASNLSFLPQDALQSLQALLDTPVPYRGNTMVQLNQQLQALEAQLQTLVGQHRDQTLQEVDARLLELEQKPELALLSAGQRNEVLEPLRSLRKRAEAERHIALLLQQQQQAEELYMKGYNRLLHLCEQLQQEAERQQAAKAAQASQATAATTATSGSQVSEPAQPIIRVPAPKAAVSQSDLLKRVRQESSKELTSEAEVVKYIESLKQLMLEQVRAEKAIRLG